MTISGAAPFTVTFTDASTPVDQITLRHWEFGDGASADDVTGPVHVYPYVGTYTVRLFIASPRGAAMATGTVEVT